MANTDAATTYNSYDAAHATLPEGARWSSSFGYPGEGNYDEFWRTDDGRRFRITNREPFGHMLGSFGRTWRVVEG